MLVKAIKKKFDKKNKPFQKNSNDENETMRNRIFF